MANQIFVPALHELMASGLNYWGPKSFQQYLSENNFSKRNTAQYISVDTIEKLSPELRNTGVMVLRLGVSGTKGTVGTQFILVKAPLNDFFIIPTTDLVPETYLPKVSIRDLFAYQVLPIFTESSLVNLSLASGLLSRALGLDDIPILNPASGKSTFTFDFRTHKTVDKVFHHNKGQVEIDSIFLGKKSGKDYLFVIEAKVNKSNLAKHKLIYPVLSIVPKLPEDIGIIPVFLNIKKTDNGFYYHVVECEMPDPRQTVIAIDQLKVRRQTYLFLPKIF